MIDHLETARSLAEDNPIGTPPTEPELSRAAVHAQIAQAEQLKRIGDLMDGTTDAPGLIGVTGHITTGAP